ncbi:hypothetical protein M573_114039 [Prevotella intermedia ZT]|uniref:Uncharacterized protein n=1 Tax=Prevotella intermedia ZT TaxID=1347790 RepID=A0AAP0VGN5_PREIN|nr:hypothetical protein M573_114039 [Prevotella intermedia ZT]
MYQYAISVPKCKAKKRRTINAEILNICDTLSYFASTK